MKKLKNKSCLIVFIIFILLIFFIFLILVLSQWQAGSPKLNLSKFSSSELFKAGQQKVKEGDLKSASKFVEAALEKDSTNVSYLGELATIRYKMADYDGAISEYQKILNTGDYNGFALNGIANIYRDISEKTEDRKQKTEYRNKAIKTYQEGIEKDGQYIALYQNYAILLISNDQPEEAKKVLQEGVQATDNQKLKDTLATIR